MAWRYLDRPYAAYEPSLSDDYPPPAPHPADASRPGPLERPPGFAYQTFLNGFALAELNVNARPYLARITEWLPLELGPHSRPGGTRRGHFKEAERERERQMEWGMVRDPRFEWSDFPRTVGWEERRRWRKEREQVVWHAGGGNVEAMDRDQETSGEQQPAQDAMNGTERADRPQQLDEPHVDVQIDFRTSLVDPRSGNASPLRSNGSTISQIRRERPVKKRVTWPRELKTRETAPVVESRFEHYCQWAHRFRDLILKLEQEDRGIKKPEDDSPYHSTDYDSDARSLEPRSQPRPSRSKYNPKADPDYQKPPPEPLFHLPIPKNNASLIKPHVPRHRQAQPTKSSFLQRTGRRVRDALVSGLGMVVGGLRRGMGAPQPRSAQVERTVEARPAIVEPMPLPPPADEGGPLPPLSTTAAPVDAEEDEKFDTDERFYTRPPSLPSESEEEDVLTTLPLLSAGPSVRSKRPKTPAVTIHTVQSLDASEERRELGPQVTVDTRRSLDDPIPANPLSPHGLDPPAPVPNLPEIGTGAARPMTRDNTAFNAAQLDFIPIPSDSPIAPTRPICNLPATATPKDREIARANERYHQHMAQWEAYLRSLAAANQDEGEVYREADTWRDVDEDDAPRRSDEEGGRGSRKRREDVLDDSDWSDDGRDGGRKGEGKRREESASEYTDVEQPDERPHPRFHSPPPEKRVLDKDEIDDDDDKEDYATWAMRIQETLKQYDKRYEPEVVDSDDSDAVNPDFQDIDLDDDLELEIDEIEIPELGAAPLYGSGFNRDRAMPKIRRPGHDREREREFKRRRERREREVDERRGSRWASGRPGQRMYGGFGN